MKEEEEARSPIGTGMTGGPTPGPSPEGEGKRKEPRWVIAFLRALERTGKAREAAMDAVVDWSTAYARRRRHADFAAAWAEALARYGEGEARGENGAFEEDQCAPPRPAAPGCPSPEGEGLTIQNGQVKRVSGERWGPSKRALYLGELAQTGNHRRAADAVGISYEAVRRRRKKDRRLEADCKAALAECRRRAPEFLASAMVATFDPESLPDDGVNPLPKMSIGEAIKIAQMDSKAGRDSLGNPFEEMAANMGEDEVDAMRERVLKRLQRLAERKDAERLAEGWSLDEATNVLVPPGWKRVD